MLERGKYGIEYDPRQRQTESSGFGWVFVAVAIAALISLTWTLVSRIRAGRKAAMELAMMEERAKPPPPPPEAADGKGGAVKPPPPRPVIGSRELVRRPQNLRNLLMRLEEAERAHDVEMAVTTIETIRALPGSPAADLDDALARRLGALNVQRLFEKKNPQWVKVVEVKRGDSASRIAAENGSTLASFACLNGGDVNRIVLGSRLYVMNHPRFNLVIHRRARTADLSLNGKFFRRYDLTGEVGGKEGAYEMTAHAKMLWKALGISLKAADSTELETLLPAGTPVLISEM